MIRNLGSRSFTIKDRFYFDANVWVSIFPLPSDPSSESRRRYSNVLKRAKKVQSDIFLDSTVVSEYINTYSRIEYRAYFPGNPTMSFKKFRETHPDEYGRTAAEITDNLAEIFSLPNVRKIDCPFGTMNVEAMIGCFGADSCDWNDQVIVETCKKNGLTLITNDGDFRNVQDLDILTYNGRLLM